MKKNAFFSLLAIVISLSCLSVANKKSSPNQIGGAAIYGGYCLQNEGYGVWGTVASTAGTLVAGAGGVAVASGSGVGVLAATAAATGPLGWIAAGAAAIL